MKYYFKATLDGGQSGYDPTYIHHEGINKHPNPDKSNQVCSTGVHLAVSLEEARRYVEAATEFYLAKPIGKIYGRDDTKIRVGDYYLWRIPADLIKVYEEARDKAWEVYVEAEAQARKVREEATAQAQKVYEEARAQAWKVYVEAEASAWEVYVEAEAPTWEVYGEARDKAWEVYVEATAPARKVYEEAGADAERSLIQVMKERGILN